MPQITITGQGGGGGGDEPPSGLSQGPTPTDPAVLSSLRDVASAIRDVKRALGSQKPFDPGPTRSDILGRLGSGTAAPTDLKSISEGAKALRRIQALRSRTEAGLAREERTQDSAAWKTLRDSVAASRTAERLRAASALPISPDAARALGAGAADVVGAARLRDRSEAAAARAARQVETSAKAEERDKWDTLKRSVAASKVMDKIRATTEARDDPERQRVESETAALKQLGASAKQFSAAQKLRDRTALQEKAAEQASLRDLGAGMKSFRAYDALKRRTLDREYRDMRAEAADEDRNHDARKRLDDRRYRDMRAEASSENAERDAKERFAARAYSAMRREAAADNQEHDRKQRFHERQVARVEKERKAAEAVERAGWRKRVDRAGLGRFVRDDESNLGTIARLAPLGRAAGIVGMVAIKAAEVAEAAIESPRVLSSVMDKFVSGAGPYRDLVYGASDLGRAGGFDGQGVVNDFLPGGGRDREWRRIRGLQAADLPGIMGAYGVSATSADSVKGLVAAAADAQYAPYLGGLGRERYASSLGLMQTLGIKGDGGFGQGADPAQGGKASGAYQYFRDLQRVMTAATSAGLDHSQVMSGLESYMRQSASSGAAEINAPKSVEAWWRMASSGSAAARTGEEQASALSGMTDQVNSGGLSGGVTANAVFQQYFSRHGGMPKSAGGWAKLLGVDPTTMQPGEKRKFDDLVAQSQTGNAALTFEYAKPFLTANGAGAWQSMVDGSGLVPQGPTHDLVAARLTGMTTDQYIDFRAGSTANLKTPAGGLGWGGIADSTRNSIYMAAGATGVDKATLAGLIDYETGGKFDNSLKSGTGAGGLGQITRTAITDLVKSGKVQGVPSAIWQKAQSDPTLNATLSGQYYALLKSRYGSDREALRYYHGLQTDKNGIGPDAYANNVMARISAYQNDPSKLDSVRASQGDFQMGAAQQSETFAEALDKASPIIVKWNDTVVTATDAVAKFTEAALTAAGKLATAHLSPPSAAGVQRYSHQVGHALASRGPLMP